MLSHQVGPTVVDVTQNCQGVGVSGGLIGVKVGVLLGVGVCVAVGGVPVTVGAAVPAAAPLDSGAAVEAGVPVGVPDSSGWIRTRACEVRGAEERPWAVFARPKRIRTRASRPNRRKTNFRVFIDLPLATTRRASRRPHISTKYDYQSRPSAPDDGPMQSREHIDEAAPNHVLSF